MITSKILAGKAYFKREYFLLIRLETSDLVKPKLWIAQAKILSLICMVTERMERFRRGAIKLFFDVY
jgi:hypothetical protein